MISARAQITSARAKQPLARAKQPLACANYLCARANYLCLRKTASREQQITSARAKPLAKDVFTLSLEFNFGTMGREPRQGGLSYDWPFLKRDI